jgi:5-methylcytosine-specific restriction endonuclease McrA
VRRREPGTPDADERREYTTSELEVCANCDGPIAIDNRGLFCSEACHQMASYVRYARRVARDPARRDDPDVAEALRIRLAFVLGGGYPAAERKLTDAARAAVVDRDSGRCQNCGGPGDQVDHIDGSSNDMSNLQLLCDRCHRQKTTSNFTPAGPEATLLAIELQATRVAPDQPARPCDDEVRWTVESRWRKSARIKMLWDQVLEDTGTDRSEWVGWPWSEVVMEWIDRAGYGDGPGGAGEYGGEW